MNEKSLKKIGKTSRIDSFSFLISWAIVFELYKIYSKKKQNLYYNNFKNIL